MKKNILLAFACALSVVAFAQTSTLDSTLQAIKLQRDSTLKAMMHGDSAKVEKEFSKKMSEARLKSVAIYPVLNGGEKSGVIPVKDITETPDPTLDYKLMFDLAENNPDSVANEINYGLAEIARVINLHVASGIPLKKIFPVIVIHAGVLNAFTTNAYYLEHYKTDNPNIKLINDLAALGTKVIACGQAIAFMEFKREALLPLVKVSLTVQTVLSSYRLKGYLKYW